MINYKKDQKGFTFVELMIVIMVILILSSVAIMTLNTSRAKARDAKRLADVQRIRTALEFYYAEENTYPVYNNLGLGQISTSQLCDRAGGSFTDTNAKLSIFLPYRPILYLAANIFIIVMARVMILLLKLRRQRNWVLSEFITRMPLA